MLRAKWNRASNPKRYVIPIVDSTKNIGFKVGKSVLSAGVDQKLDITVIANEQSSLNQKLVLKLSHKEHEILNQTFSLTKRIQIETLNLTGISEILPNGGIF